MTIPKIYYIANVRMPTDRAHGIQLIKTVEALSMSGADTELIVPARIGGDICQVKEFYGLKRDIRIKKIFAPHILSSTRAGFLISSFFFGLSYFMVLFLKKIRGEKFIVYTVDLDHISFVPLAFLGAPYFIEIHGEKKATSLHKKFFHQASGIIALNTYIKKNLAEIFSLNEEKIAVLPNGIDIEQFREAVTKAEARKKLSVPENKRIILYIGRIYDWKGVEILFDAAKKFSAELLLYFVGGSREEALLAVKKKIPENLIFIGAKSQLEIPLWIAASDAVLLLGTAKNKASYYFTSPMKLFEYMAAKRPIIASKTPAVSDIVSDSEVFFYEPDSADDLCKTTKAVLGDTVLAKSKSDLAFEKVKDFSWSKRAERILSFIEDRIK